MNARWLSLVLGLASWVAAADGPPTGVIVDASRLEVERRRFPRLVDPDGDVVYPPPKLVNNQAYLQAGFAGYKASLSEARKDTKKAGARPLVILPTGLFEDDPTRGSMTVTAETAEQLRQLNRAQKLLDDDKLLIVIGLAVIATQPAAGATDAPLETVVSLTFSRPLRPDSVNRLGTLTVADSAGQALAGQVTFRESEKRLLFTPTNRWKAGETYKVTVSGRLEATNRATLGEDFVLQFTIKPPADGSAGGAAADKEEGGGRADAPARGETEATGGAGGDGAGEPERGAPR